MEKYVAPKAEKITACEKDVITTSPGTETPRYEESLGDWDLNITN